MATESLLESFSEFGDSDDELSVSDDTAGSATKVTVKKKKKVWSQLSRSIHAQSLTLQGQSLTMVH